jgi:hypothetical protein
LENQQSAQEIYLTAYEAFEGGDFGRARSLAEACLEVSPQDSYWYAGALGLKCWITSFENLPTELEETAAALIALDTGGDALWFEGLARLTLGISKRRQGKPAEARELFHRAGQCYAAQELHPGQPEEWRDVLDYFSTLCVWAASGEGRTFDDFLAGLATHPQGELIQQLTAAAQLMIRYAAGEDVRTDAVDLVKQGVSRTFIAFPLMEEG